MLSRLRSFAARVRESAAPSRLASEQDEEFRFHLEMETEENLRRGMSAVEARRMARIAFGGEQKFREATRDRRGLAAVRETGREMLLAARRLRRRPGLVGAVVVTLALGIGANTAVFSLIDTVLLRPVIAPDADRLVRVFASSPSQPTLPTSFAEYEAFAGRATSLAGVAAYTTRTVPLQQGADAEDVGASFVTNNYFAVLRIRPALGRVMSPTDSPFPGANPVAVLSGAFWRSHFHGDSSILGTSISVHGMPLTVIGVMPDRFVGPDLSDVPDLWVPAPLVVSMNLPLLANRGSLMKSIPLWLVVGRLREGSTPQRAAIELTTLQRQLVSGGLTTSLVGRPARVPTANADDPVKVIPLADVATGPAGRQGILRIVKVLVAVVGLMLLLACLNIGNLMLLRAHERAREIGVRIALGAGSGHIVEQLVIESLLLAVIGGIAGLGIAALIMHAMSAFTLPGHLELDRLAMRLDSHVLAAACLTTLLTALAFGVVPAIAAARTNAADVLRGRASHAALSRHRLALTSIQVAISLVLLVGGALLLRSIEAGFNTGVGFDPRGIAALSLAPKFDGTAAGNLREWRAVVATLRDEPGVSAAAGATHVPLARYFARPFAIGDALNSGAPDAQTVGIGTNHVIGDYFGVLGIRVLEGRAFGDQDAPDARPVIILNQSAARALFPRGSAIGQVVHAPFFGPVVHSYTVVGVVTDTKYASLQDDRVPFAYLPVGQEDLLGSAVTFVARSKHPRDVLPEMARVVKEEAPDMKLAASGSPTTKPRLVSDQISAVLAPQRFGAALLTTLAVLALCVSAVGIFGTVSYSVARRTGEIGIRKALGARSGDVIALVVRQTATAVCLGGVAGLIAAAVGSRFLRALLYGVGPLDLASFLLAALVTVAIAASAALVPSVRSTRIDPIRAIQAEG